MDLTAFWVMPLLYLTSAVPHRGIPVGIPLSTNEASFWDRTIGVSGDLVSDSVPGEGTSNNGNIVPFTLDKGHVIARSGGTASNLGSETENRSKNIAARSSTVQGSNRHSLLVRKYKPMARRPKTVTKKMAGRPRTSRMSPSLLITDNINTLQQPKCHMPWINELSKIQYYWDGINALCDIAMTFEPCSTSGSICRRYPVQFMCCPSTSLAVLKKCYKDNPLPENVCLPTTIQMSGALMKPRSRPRPVVSRRHFDLVTPETIPASKTAVEVISEPTISKPEDQHTIFSSEPLAPNMKFPTRVLSSANDVTKDKSICMSSGKELKLISGCTSDCSPAWIDLFSNIKRVRNETLPVCQFLNIFKSCSTSGLPCTSYPVSSNCCPIKCVPDLEKCFMENPPDFVCTPRTIQPWITRLRKYFTG